MNIAIDARWIFPEISGIGAYTRELIRELAQLPARHQFLLLFSDDAVLARTRTELGLDRAPHMRTLRVPYGLFSPRSQLALPSLLHRQGVRVYHSTNYMIPLLAFPRNRRGNIRAVVTIHDVIPLLFPDHAPRSKKARVLPLYRALMREIGRRADTIVTDSQASARDIVRELAIPAARAGDVRTIHCGVSQRFVPPADAPRARPASEPRRLLYVGRADPYKNVATLIRVFARVRERLPVPVELVIAGAPDPRYPEAAHLARELGLTPHIRWTGYLSDDALVRLYQESDALVHCSRYEGFGLQIVEAMACGLPVVCSNAGSIPEVAGDAALLAAPDDVATLAQHVETILTQPDVADSCRRRGLQQAARFTWRRAATDVLRLYEELESP